MADFFKGLAGGFGTGLQFGRAMRERRMEDDLAKAYAKPEEYVDYTPEQTREIQRLQETGAYDVQALPGAEGAAPTLRYTPRQGLDLGQGEMPAAPTDIAPGQVQRYGGRTTAGQFNPTELRGLQMQEAARVLGSYGDAKGAAALQAQAEEQAYQAKYRPLQLKQLEGNIAGQEQQRELTGIQLGSAKRTEAEQLNASNFSAFAAENPNLSTAELKDAAFKQFKFSPKQWQDAVNTRLGIAENEQKEFVLGIKGKLKGKNLQQLGSLYNSDPDFDDKTDLAIVPGKNGAVTLNFIDKATNKITSSQSFNNEALATEYLNKQATEPETIGSWMLALLKNQAAIDASKASTAKDNSLAARYARDEPEKGLTKKITEMETVLGRKLSPAEKETALGLIGKPRDEKPQKVEEAGVQYKVGGKLVQTDGMGGFMSTKGVLPSDRPAALKAAGVSDNNSSRLVWSNDGEAVMFNNEEYNVADKRDMSKLNKALEAYDTLNRKISEEDRLRSNPTGPSGFQGARTTGVGPASSYGVAPGAPSIYGR
jgi:hypothetical protein